MKVLTSLGDTSLLGLGGVALMGIPVNYWLATLAIVYAVMRIVMAGIEFYWKWKDRRNGTQDREDGGDGATARADRPDAHGNDPANRARDPS